MSENQSQRIILTDRAERSPREEIGENHNQANLSQWDSSSRLNSDNFDSSILDSGFASGFGKLSGANSTPGYSSYDSQRAINPSIHGDFEYEQAADLYKRADAILKPKSRTGSRLSSPPENLSTGAARMPQNNLVLDTNKFLNFSQVTAEESCDSPTVSSSRRNDYSFAEEADTLDKTLYQQQQLQQGSKYFPQVQSASPTQPTRLSQSPEASLSFLPAAFSPAALRRNSDAQGLLTGMSKRLDPMMATQQQPVPGNLRLQSRSQHSSDPSLQQHQQMPIQWGGDDEEEVDERLGAGPYPYTGNNMMMGLGKVDAKNSRPASFLPSKISNSQSLGELLPLKNIYGQQQMPGQMMTSGSFGVKNMSSSQRPGAIPGPANANYLRGIAAPNPYQQQQQQQQWQQPQQQSYGVPPSMRPGRMQTSGSFGGPSPVSSSYGQPFVDPGRNPYAIPAGFSSNPNFYDNSAAYKQSMMRQNVRTMGEPQAPLSSEMIYQVQFKRNFRYFILSPTAQRDVKPGDFVKVEADRGEDLGIVHDIMTPQAYMEHQYRQHQQHLYQQSMRLDAGQVREEEGSNDIKQILRLASTYEKRQLATKIQEEFMVVQNCRQLASSVYMLPMNIADAEYQFDRHKLTIYYDADRRVDFREFVRDLFALYKARIWLQQIDHTGFHGSDMLAYALSTGVFSVQKQGQYIQQLRYGGDAGAGGGRSGAGPQYDDMQDSERERLQYEQDQALGPRGNDSLSGSRLNNVYQGDSQEFDESYGQPFQGTSDGVDSKYFGYDQQQRMQYQDQYYNDGTGDIEDVFQGR